MSLDKKNILLLPVFILSVFLLSSCGSFGKKGNRANKLSEDNPKKIVPATLSRAARADYNGRYQRDLRNKAFAIAPSGAYGVAYGAFNSEQARQAALRKCAEDLSRGDYECIIYDVNGFIIYKPSPLRRVE